MGEGKGRRKARKNPSARVVIVECQRGSVRVSPSAGNGNGSNVPCCRNEKLKLSPCH